MIKAVFFDFYGTLVKWLPAAEEIQRDAAAAEGLTVDPFAIAAAYFTADRYMDSENAKSPIAQRSTDERDWFFGEYERLLLTTAGYDVRPELASRIWTRVRATPKELALYEDALPALSELKDAGLAVGVISNMGTELGAMLAQLTVTDFASLWVSSGEARVSKPHRGIFEAALRKARVSADEAVHVGDSYESDVRGALGAGMHPLLVWRQHSASAPGNSPSVNSLRDVLPYLKLHHQVD
jgi:HAD superfamily hydrolase (TIGR01549 family)